MGAAVRGLLGEQRVLAVGLYGLEGKYAPEYTKLGYQKGLLKCDRACAGLFA